jgi:DMSO/TMAO reductase YedYZ molybdopterin-dependent catalytic subunit
MSVPIPNIISPDTMRSKRVPPGQHTTRHWPVLHAGSVPGVDLPRWDLKFFGLLAEPRSWTWDDLQTLPRVHVAADMHCVTQWSLLDNLWEGVSTNELASRLTILTEARYVLIHAEQGFTTNLPIEDFLGRDCLFAWSRNGEPLSPDHGWPLRLVIPRLYAWKSAKWVRGVEFLAEDRAGFWEQNGYHHRGDPWAEQRFW